MTDSHNTVGRRSRRVAIAIGLGLFMSALLPAFAIGFTPLAGTLAIDPPTAPADLTSAPANKPVIAKLAWKTSESLLGIEYYEIYVSARADGPFRKVGNTGQNSFEYKNGLPGTAYYFKVVAFDRVGRQSLDAKTGPVSASWRQSPHGDVSTATDSCSSCHQTHQATSAALGRSDITTSSADASVRDADTCYSCHNGRGAESNIATGTSDSFALSSGHTLEFATTGADLTNSCASCHDPHADERSNPMLVAPKINGANVGSNGSQLCLACHERSGDWFGPGYPATHSPRRDAKGYPVAGTWPGSAAYKGSGNAHFRIPATTQTTPGGTVDRGRGDCTYCHASHRGPSSYDGLLADFRPSSASTLATDQASGAYAAVCLRCHSGAVPSGFTTAPADIERFVTSGSANAGHRIKTAGGLLPVGAPMPCYECHNPHGSTRGNASLLSDVLGGDLSTADDASVRQYCFTCHTTSDTGAGWDSTAAGYESPAVGAEVVGISRTGGVLRLPAIGAHEQASTTACTTCHGNSYGAGGNNVHDPAVPSGSAGDAIAPLDTPSEPSSSSITPTAEAMLGVDCRSCHAAGSDPVRS